MEVIILILTLFVIAVFLKAIIIGSDFSFIIWFQDGKKYMEWYNNRPKYKQEIE